MHPTRRADPLFAQAFTAPIGPQGRGGRIGVPRAVAPTRKDIIGGDMDKGDAQIGTGARHRSRGIRVDDGGQRLFTLGAVDSRIGGRIDHRAGAMGMDRSSTGGWISEIGLRAAKRRDRGQTAQFRGHLAAGAEDEDRHHPTLPNLCPTPSRSCSARHQSSWARYQSTVRASPSSTVTDGSQPSSSRMRAASMA